MALLSLGILSLLALTNSSGVLMNSTMSAKSVVNSLAGEGTIESPYLISTGEELKEWAFSSGLTDGKKVTSHAKLVDDVILSLTASEKSLAGLSGSLDGDNHEITLDVNVSTTAVALFKYNYGTIKNVVLRGSVVESGYSTALVGQNWSNGYILNCTNYASISSTSSTGYTSPFAYFNYGVIDGCVNYGNITGTNRSAGISADNYAVISNCSNYGDISGTGGFIGGLVGVLGRSSDVKYRGSISYSTNYGNVTSNYASSSADIGGLVGFAYPNFEISNSSNLGTVSYNEGVRQTGIGGLVGRIKTGSGVGDMNFTSCYAGGNINVSHSYSGGLIGFVDSGCTSNLIIKDCLVGSHITTYKPTSSGTYNYFGAVSGQVVNSLTDISNTLVIENITCPDGLTPSYSAVNYTGDGVTSVSLPQYLTSISANLDEVLSEIRTFNCGYKADAIRSILLTSPEMNYLHGLTYTKDEHVLNYGDIVEGIIAGENHIYGEEVVTTELTSEHDGEATSSCVLCDHDKVRTLTVASELSTYVNKYLLMDVVSVDNGADTGACLTNYAIAKAAFNSLPSVCREAFINDEVYELAKARLLAWANANGDILDLNTTQLVKSKGVTIFKETKNASISVVLIIAGVSFALLAGVIIKKHKEN